MGAWSGKTKKCYNTYLNKWRVFCKLRNISILNPPQSKICDFLVSLRQKKKKNQYQTVNVARCALSAYLPTLENGQTVGKQMWVSRAVKAAFRESPPQAKYSEFWDVRVLFTLFRSWPENDKLDRVHLGYKLLLLMLLCTGERGQAIHAISVKKIQFREDGTVTCPLTKLCKTDGVGKKLRTLVLQPFHKEEKLCQVCCLKRYLLITKPIRGSEDELFLTLKKRDGKFHAITQDTAKRWTLKTMEMAGIDTGRYKTHSSRGAMISAGDRLRVNVETLMQHGRWKSEKTMAKHYRKPLEEKKKSKNLGQMVLEDFVK